MNQAKITIYYTPFCPYCGWAKQLLKQKKVDFTLINVNDGQHIRKEMEQRASGRTSVPQIFIGEVHIGGYDDMAALDDKGELDSLIEAR
ncbi:Glutaredoxin 3 (Grx3) [hydrothermal vent metagenome]|uniref:Glutaredoxin 3 (Grx3) n=1 Tax=hydrothermal vent metagenome TaxID=652676 RepID=A0A3B0WYM3_9ZZZZ